MTSALERAVKASGPDAVLSALSEPETLARAVALVQHMAAHYGISYRCPRRVEVPCSSLVPAIAPCTRCAPFVNLKN